MPRLIKEINNHEEGSYEWVLWLEEDPDEPWWEINHGEESNFAAAERAVEEAYAEDVSNTLPMYVNVYEITRRYGGPEEGGWWWDFYTPVSSLSGILCPTTNTARIVQLALFEKYKDGGHRFSMAPRGRDYAVLMEGHTGMNFPTERPHYE